MTSAEYYDNMTADEWKPILGEDLHYHFGFYEDGMSFEEGLAFAVRRLIRFLDTGNRIADIGCGWGGPANVLAEHGYQVTGVTNSSRQHSYCRSLGLACEFLDVDDDDVKRLGHFDAVFMMESLEHVFDALVLEIPVPQSRVTIREPNCSLLLFHLMRPRRERDLREIVPGMSSAQFRALTKALYGLRILRPAGQDEIGDARYWEFHDLVLHARSRSWQRLEPTGATFRFGNGRPPVPALKPPLSDARIQLFRPELGALTREGVTLTAALEQRRSVRESSGQTITAKRLGEFLYRAAGVREIRVVPEPDGPVQVTRRPYPAAGGCYELEIYVLARRCDGLESGLYHYLPGEHELSRIAVSDAHLRQLLAGAEAASGGAMPQILFVITARLPRIAWKYEGIAYALVLKNVGALFQTMYLVATAMGLRPCALGGGDGPLFAQATGVDLFSEPSVGEFMLSA